MMACVGRNSSPLFKLITHKTVVFDEVYMLFHFNIILKQNEMSSTKKSMEAVVCSISLAMKDSAFQEAAKIAVYSECNLS